MTLPWLQQEFNLVKVKDLGGEYAKTVSIPFNIDDWLDGLFQSNQEKYLNENFGFRNSCVRLNNQLAFSLFNYAHAVSTVVGKDNYLYGDTYIKAYFGADFLGWPKIKDNIRKLKFVKDVLKKKGINLMVVFVPGKASFFPEFLPDEPNYQKKTTNYEAYRELLPESGIPYLDLCSYFIGQKNKSPYPLFPKTGIHWSVFAAEVAADTIGRFIGKLRNTELPRIHIKQVLVDDTIRGTDADIEMGMNLMFKIPKFKMGYPVVDIDFTNKIRPRVLTIADSYFWGIYGSGRANQIFNKPHFWYYYTDLFVPEQVNSIPRDSVNLQKEIEQQEVIMILANDSRALDLGSGFIDDAYDLYANGGRNLPYVIRAQKKKDAVVKRKMEEIRGNKEWFEAIKKQAFEKNEPLDSALKSNAGYIYDLENNK
jgi:hypothetical protein